ncbi:anucleate primary sterigmata protein A [Podospora aff. communis PSN243]|uniref:Anucleate primary sterigmata protein A n=1 Tax=Podospora aff. communis PSN243 TaxID=3040156 RepID=A0AAV9GVY9_9PEZI|nr:anucleate primary sterigmata protein A [Podospora aff. communis PSN243]
MATSIASDKPIAAGDGFDPFVTSPSGQTHLRHSTFDSQLFALGPGTSAEQVKRAIEAHLKDTERRMEEAGKLGTALVQQRKELTDRLREVEQLQAEGEPGQELRQRLAEIEKDYNDVARETARAFLPKQRIPSNEAAQGSPFAPEGKGGRRSVSPSKFESMATGSPTKLSVPNRKLRNQPANRIHDIEFAAEISTSLISQVRHLQALLAEREEELRDIKVERSRLELEAEGFQQRMKTLDESENRYKDENWNLETQMREMMAAQKDAADREKKLQQSLNALQTEKNATQRELEEVKDNLAKQDEKYAAAIKNLEIELGTSRRNAAISETERMTMQRKVEELTSQNQELAKAFSIQRVRAAERESGFGLSEDDFHTATDNATPEHSPPPSPVKGTPRHSVLESETLKTSLGHAQRTIQTLRTNIHREKTEKLELKRMLQDARDELEKMRNDPSTTNRRSRKVESREFKKPRLGQLGGARSSRTELFIEDPEWEDQVESHSPGASSHADSTLRLPAYVPPVAESASEHFDTANETSDAAFETAHERGTETEDFQTGAEELSDDDDAATETEASPSKGSSRIKRPPVLPMNYSSNRYSFESTASTSDDNDDYGLADLRTPTAPTQKMRLRVSRGALLNRRSRQVSEEPNLQSSPVSFAGSTSGTPQQGQSLFAELGDFEGGSDDDSYVGGTTPSRRSIRSVTPGSFARGRASPPPEVPALPKVIMVDSGMMTEPVQVGPALTASKEVEAEVLVSPQSVIFNGRPMSMESVVGPCQSHASTQWLGDDFGDEFSRPLSTFSYSDASVQNDTDLESKLAQFPSPPTSPPKIGLVPTPILRPPERLIMSHILSEQIEPFEVPSTPPLLSVSSILSEDTEPVADPPATPPTFSLSSVVSEQVEPQAEPELIPLPLTLSSLRVEHVEPRADPETPLPTPPRLSMAALVSQDVEPVVEPASLATAPGSLSLSSIQAEQVEPVELPLVAPLLVRETEHKIAVPAPAPLTLSSIVAEHVEPRSEPVVSPAPLSFAPISTAEVEPRPEPAQPPPALSISEIRAQHVEPRERPASPLPVLGISTVVSQEIEPLLPQEPVVTPPMLSVAGIQTLESRPVEPVADEPAVLAPPLSVASILSLESEPVSPRSPKRNAFIIPRDLEEVERAQPQTPPNAMRGWDAVVLGGNEGGSAAQKNNLSTTDQGAQTALTSEALDQILKAKNLPFEGAGLTRSNSAGSIGTPSTVRVHRPRQASIDSTGRSWAKTGDTVADTSDSRRPGSSASTRGSLRDLPPLPANHKQVIEAARTGSSSGAQGATGTMGPPLFPASVLRAQNVQNVQNMQSAPYRPRTPNGSKRPMSPISVASGRGTPTPRAARGSSTNGTQDLRSPTSLTQHSRKSSVSSFESELDTRFNMQNAGAFDTHGFGPNTDPRMIQAITQTMIGEYLWKYTRKAGRGELSGNRHRRYFWVHPYTRTLYWSDRDPSAAGRAELRAKSVPIEAVRVVTDDNPMPPGLHRKSLVIISPGRTIKFTCTTGQRHETWFNALSYLLLRTHEEGHTDTEEMAGNITREDVDEFNPSYGRRVPNGTRTVASLSSYNSRTVRNESPMMSISMDIPTLTPTHHKKSAEGRPSVGTLSRISGYWKDNGLLSGTFGSLRSRSVSGRDPTHAHHSIYEASEVQDSAEDLRQIIERQDREADRLENVRACCDGKLIYKVP